MQETINQRVLISIQPTHSQYGTTTTIQNDKERRPWRDNLRSTLQIVVLQVLEDEFVDEQILVGNSRLDFRRILQRGEDIGAKFRPCSSERAVLLESIFDDLAEILHRAHRVSETGTDWSI